MADTPAYPARFNIDYPKQLDRLTSFFRLIWAIPICIILGLLSDSTTTRVVSESGQIIKTSSGIAAGLTIATILMILFRQKYPRWWFDFALELARFSARVGAYLLLLTDKYPSTDEEQSVHLDVKYPNVKTKLNRWLPLVKWLLAIPHYIVLAVLFVLVVLVTIIAWFAILFTGSYPRGLFNFVVGTLRWGTRVWAYAFLMATDEYPPFSMS